MSVSNNQINQFVNEIFQKHSTSNKQVLTTSQLFNFFSNFIKGSKQITITDVQKTLRLVKTENQDIITKNQMYDIIIKIIEKRKPNQDQNRDKKQMNQQKEIEKQKNKDRIAASLDVQNFGNRRGVKDNSLTKNQMNQVNNLNPYGLPNRFITDQRVKNQFVSPHRMYPYPNQNIVNLLTFR